MLVLSCFFGDLINTLFIIASFQACSVYSNLQRQCWTFLSRRFSKDTPVADAQHRDDHSELMPAKEKSIFSHLNFSQSARRWIVQGIKDNKVLV